MINNVEFDHADIYADFDAVSLAFRRLVNLVPRRGLLLLGADSAGARALKPAAVSRVETFGLGDGVDWQAHDLESSGRRPRFRVRRGGSPFGAVRAAARRRAQRPQRAGRHRRRDRSRPRAPSRSPRGLRSFAGVKRRLEVVGTAGGVTIYDDFAHHPTAVAETLAGLRASHPAARIWAVFEPRSASSCRRIFQDDFARAFAAADGVLIAPVFRSTLPEAERLSVPALVRDLDASGRSGAGGRLDRRHRRPPIVREHRAGRSGGDHVERRLRRHPSEAAAGAVVAPVIRPVTRDEPSASSCSAIPPLIVEFAERASIRRQRPRIRLAEAVQDAAFAGVRDVVPTYRSVAVFFDPLRTDYRGLVEWLERQVDRLAEPPSPDRRRSAFRCATEASSAPILLRSPRSPTCSPQDVIAIHAGATYRVFMLGFMPGLCLHGGRRSAHCGAAPLDAARARAERGRSGSPANRPASIRPRHPAAGSSSAGRRSSRSTHPVSAVSVSPGRCRPVRADRARRIRPADVSIMKQTMDRRTRSGLHRATLRRCQAWWTAVRRARWPKCA